MTKMRKYAKVLGGGIAALGLIGFATAGEGVMTPQQAEQLNKEKWKFQNEKRQDETNGAVSNLFFRSSATNIPHKSKAHRGGEDAWVANDSLLVVADGVGGWAN